MRAPFGFPIPAIISLAAFGCSVPGITYPDGSAAGGGGDTGIDTASIDTGADSGRRDSPAEIDGSGMGDTGVDAGADRGGADRGVDAGPDGGVDAGPDGGVDAGPDGGVDAGPDGGADGGGPNGGGPDGGDRHNVAFVTSRVYGIDTLGGVAGADAKCQALATTAGLPGTYVAWISDSVSSVASRLGMARGWVRPDGKPFWDYIHSPATFFPPEVTELGVHVSDTPPAVGGDLAGSQCADWTSTSGGDYFNAGDPTAGWGGWNAAAEATACQSPFRLYCLGKDLTNPLTVTPTPGRTAFVSTAWLPGGGLSDADAHCQSDAQLAGLTGQFKAALATATTSMASRFDLTGPPWVRVDGIPIVDAAADLFVAGGKMVAPLNVTALGLHISNEGALSGGGDPTVAGTIDSTCDSWTSTSGTATAGAMEFSILEKAFARMGMVACDSQYLHVYCLQD